MVCFEVDMKFLWVNLNGIIVDYSWYADRVLEVDSWSLKTFGYQPRDGMSLTFKEESHKMFFFLRWS